MEVIKIANAEELDWQPGIDLSTEGEQLSSAQTNREPMHPPPQQNSFP